MGVAVVMSNPQRAQRFAGVVVQRNDQVFDDRRLDIAQGGECPLRSRYANRRAGIQTEPAGTGIAGRVRAFVRSQRPADRRPAHDRPARAVVTQQTQACAACLASAACDIEDVPQGYAGLSARIFDSSQNAAASACRFGAALRRCNIALVTKRSGGRSCSSDVAEFTCKAYEARLSMTVRYRTQLVQHSCTRR